MSYFFKVYLNSLAEFRASNLPENIKYLNSDDRNNLLFIYAGGDDLFISGAWNEIVEFAFDIYQCFRAYTGEHPDISISGGISFSVPKYPLYQAASESGDAEHEAKGNGRDSLGLFGEVFKWDEWLGNKDRIVVQIQQRQETDNVQKVLKEEDLEYLLLGENDEAFDKLNSFGIYPFVKKLQQQQISVDYTRAFVRNLLSTAQIQEQMLKKIKEKRRQKLYEDEDKDIQYYLHLPKIAYTLARLPKKVFDDDDFRKSLKSPWNAPYFRAIATWIRIIQSS